ncbi:MAG: type IV secretion system protein [Rickettsiales bacterium]
MKQQFLTLLQTLCVALLVFTAAPVQAQNANGELACTDFTNLATKIHTGTPGILSSITKVIKEKINAASENLFYAFTTSPAYQTSVAAALTLMVLFFGVGFMIGIVQASFGQILIRMIKMGIIITLISPGGWTFFSEYVIQFFNDGTDQLIGSVMEIGTGQRMSYDQYGNAQPFTAIDGIAQFMLSPSMIITMIGTITNGGSYGLAMGMLLMLTFGGFVKLLIDGLKVYALSYMIRALLLGVAPVFFIFMLFQKTNQLFMGWVNMMVSISLKPILFFTFLSFFLVMLSNSAVNLMGGSELCYTEYKSSQGTPNKLSNWRFVQKGQKIPSASQSDWKGPLDCQLAGRTDCKPFPINIVDILTFIILVYVAGQFAKVVDHIADDIANTSVNLSTQGKLDMKMGGGGGASTNVPAGGQNPSYQSN